MMVGALATLIGGGLALNMGASGSVEMAETLSGILVLYMAGLLGGGLIVERKDKQLNQEIEALLAPKKQLAKKYNKVIDLLEDSYKLQKTNSFFNENSKIRNEFRALYSKHAAEYQMELKQLEKQRKADSPKMRLFKRYWTAVFAVGILLSIGSCCYTTGVMGQYSAKPVAAATASRPATSETTEWNAENIPMPHLTDGLRYVSNPDGVVTPHTEQLLNQWLKRLDDSLQIESAMIIVNHVENGDVFTMAQDLFDKYKIGKDDRGLVVLLAYEDHKVRTHTGRALEADLTDVECSRLQQTYAIPFMRSEQPDSGMLYLTEAIYNTLKKKDLPLTWEQQQEKVTDELANLLVLQFMILLGWFVAGIYLYRRYNGKSLGNALRSNPFHETPIFIMGGFGGGRGGGGFGNGGIFGGGGGFSGGSSGGGGATSSW